MVGDQGALRRLHGDGRGRSRGILDQAALAKCPSRTDLGDRAGLATGLLPLQTHQTGKDDVEGHARVALVDDGRTWTVVTDGDQSSETCPLLHSEAMEAGHAGQDAGQRPCSAQFHRSRSPSPVSSISSRTVSRAPKAMSVASCGIFTWASGAPSATRCWRSRTYDPGATRFRTGGPRRCDSRFVSYSELRVHRASSITRRKARQRSGVIDSPTSAYMA